MHTINRFRIFLFISGFFFVTGASAQSQTDEIGPFPTALSTEQLQLLPQPGPATVPEPQEPHARRRLPRRVLPLTAEEISYREVVQKLGVDKHRFVHCDLSDGKVRTGVITEIRDDGFTLKDGILISQWIPYSSLKAAPRPVPAVGTRIVHGLKWAGVGVGMVALIPLLPLLYIGFHDC